MVSTFTPNVQLEEPARGDDVGVWDTPVNSNMTLLDLLSGGIATIPLNNANVTLSAGQFRSKTLTFNSTLTGSVVITFPTSFTKSYEIQHLCTGSSAFTITLATTAAGGQVIAVPPGEIVDCLNDGTNIKFKNMGRIGEYWDYAAAAPPIWVAACTIPPYLNCDGSAFSAATYPVLRSILGGTTLPDTRGRSRFALDQGTGRNINVIQGNTIFTGGGDQFTQNHIHGTTEVPHVHAFTAVQNTAGGLVSGGTGSPLNPIASNTAGAVTGLTINAYGSGGSQNLPPLVVSGIMLIRAG